MGYSWVVRWEILERRTLEVVARKAFVVLAAAQVDMVALSALG